MCIVVSCIILLTKGPVVYNNVKIVVKVNIMSSDLIGECLTLNLNQPIKWADFRLDALLADTMLTKFYTTGPKAFFRLRRQDIQGVSKMCMLILTRSTVC
jgi:hypothetical protein